MIELATVYNYYRSEIRDIQNQPEISWHYISQDTGLKYSNNPKITRIFEDLHSFTLTNLSAINTRFNKAVIYASQYDYGIFLLTQEMWHPLLQVWWKQRTLSDWSIDGTLTLTNNRNKQRIIVARVHRKIRNQRKDFAHKTGRMLVNHFDRIVFEKLSIRNMVQNHCLAKSISDAGWGQLISLTRSKAEEAGTSRCLYCTTSGKSVSQVNPNGTSQTCICGYPVPKDLSVRIHSCPSCGLVLNRDHVSAILIEKRDQVPTDCGEFTPVEIEPILCR